MNDLSKLADALERSAAKRKAEEAEILAKLGDPHATYNTQYAVWGVWHVQDGYWIMPRGRDNWNWSDRSQVTDLEFAALIEASKHDPLGASERGVDLRPASTGGETPPAD